MSDETASLAEAFAGYAAAVMGWGAALDEFVSVVEAQRIGLESLRDAIAGEDQA